MIDYFSCRKEKMIPCSDNLRLFDFLFAKLVVVLVVHFLSLLRCVLSDLDADSSWAEELP